MSRVSGAAHTRSGGLRRAPTRPGQPPAEMKHIKYVCLPPSVVLCVIFFIFPPSLSPSLPPSLLPFPSLSITLACPPYTVWNMATKQSLLTMWITTEENENHNHHLLLSTPDKKMNLSWTLPWQGVFSLNWCCPSPPRVTSKCSPPPTKISRSATDMCTVYNNIQATMSKFMYVNMQS